MWGELAAQGLEAQRPVWTLFPKVWEGGGELLTPGSGPQWEARGQ